MRLLHTSDWHLGRSFGPVPLHDDQCAFVDWFVATAVQQGVELVVIAGDVYDRAVPPTRSIELLRSALVRLHDAGISVVVIAGNHDGPERVAAYDGLLDASGVYVRGGYDRAGEVLQLQFADGPLSIVAVPYLDPVLQPIDAPEGERATEPIAPVEAGSAGVPLVDDSDLVAPRVRRSTHHEVLQAALERARTRGLGARSVAVAHAFVTAAGRAPAESESERQLTVGGHGQVDAGVFQGFSYTALGHLHTPQSIGSPTIRYSGTPLAYSFSEVTPKQVVLVELGADGAADVTPLPVPVGRRVATIEGTLEQLLASPRPQHVDDFVRAVLTDPGPVIDAKVQLQRVYPWVVEVQLRPADRDDAVTDAASAQHRNRLQPIEAAAAYWADVHRRPLSPAEHLLLAMGLQQVRQQ